ncbi:hypothetical protein J8TS2_42430 [Lederbergia ruris]|uniref:Uncharacterized protein n=1 Tax=Lederbergia ruris TaxID=217495 RepID=A0ABQ4KQT9_9BACI|nr:hypothetical protein [Lederbergia ruris]GIN59924.1 hypothetical protein J8TS2_42430 [Lederbergia ruris]
MNQEEFMSLSMNEKLRTVNQMLEKEEKDHLKNASEKVGIPYSAFTKIMRDNGNYQYNQTSKRYEKLLSLEEYEQYLQVGTNKVEELNETLSFLEEHLDELKKLLVVHQNQLILDPVVYDPSCKTASKSFQVNVSIYDQFTELCSIQFPHLRQKDLVSQCLLDFVRKYQKTRSE